MAIESAGDERSSLLASLTHLTQEHNPHTFLPLACLGRSSPTTVPTHMAVLFWVQSYCWVKNKSLFQFHCSVMFLLMLSVIYEQGKGRLCLRWELTYTEWRASLLHCKINILPRVGADTLLMKGLNNHVFWEIRLLKVTITMLNLVEPLFYQV